MTLSLPSIEARLLAELESAAKVLRADGEEAFAFLLDEGTSEPVLSLEVSRSGGNWQRNLVVTLEPAGSAIRIVVKVNDDEQFPVVLVGDRAVAPAQVASVAREMTRSGIAALQEAVATA